MPESVHRFRSMHLPGLLRPPPSEPGPLDESLWDRTKRDAARVRRAWQVRAAVTVVNVAIGITVAEELVSANKPGAGIAFWTVLALVGAGLIEVGSVYVTQALAAPVRQRNEAREAVTAVEHRSRRELEGERDRFDEAQKSYRESFDQQSAKTEDLRGQLGEAEARATELEQKLDAQKGDQQRFLRDHARLQGQFGSNVTKLPPELVAARRIRTELKDALRKATTYADAAARLPEGQGLHYEKGFRFDTDAWKQYAADLAGFPAYDTVDAAYTEIGRANDVIGWRETGAKGLYGVTKEDDLPAVVSATNAAVKALDDLVLETGAIRTPYEHLAEKLRAGFALSSREPSEKRDQDVKNWTRSAVTLLKRDAPERVAEFGAEEPDFAAFDPADPGIYWKGPNADAFLRRKLRALEKITKDVRH